MKNKLQITIALITLTLFTRTTLLFSQNTITDVNIQVYVLNGPQCTHWYYASVTDSILGVTPLYPVDIDTFPQQYIYKYVVQSITELLPSTATFQFCAVTTPPCTCVDNCVTTSVGYGGAITLLLCGTTTSTNELETNTDSVPFRQKFFNSDVLKIVFDPCEVGNDYFVFNTSGALVQSGVINNCDFVLDLRNLPFGLYLLRTNNNKNYKCYTK